ncbi:MAG: FkbM family methyltransferase [Saprospiraceae bacterium]|nr:FkbM family methyltransferase [Saprospiraceae bacterium]MCF8251425.1 FkbM family methyltransferase [Saprospiraceae bacterium]MCF8312699.1 FkbM family methyltransferase [Saprospiraceae bacterium]MCF8441035.1 FkbM family methyltransferase [Saprospiraceae bacterium]
MIENLPFGVFLKSFLESSKTYRRWKHSEAGLWLWQQFAKKQGAVIQAEDRFYKYLLSPIRYKKAPIFDIGANTGWQSKTFLHFSHRVVAVEPDAINQGILLNRLGYTKAFFLVPMAVSSENGFRELLIHEAGSALNTFSDKWRQELESGFLSKPYPFSSSKLKVPTTSLDLLIAQYGLPSLAKIDVEGHELEVIKGLSQPIPLVVFEANLPAFLEETKSIVYLLEKISPALQFNYSLEFQLELKEYISPVDFIILLNSLGKCSIDVICRMENYPKYYFDNPEL